VNPEDFGFRTQSLEPARAANAPESARIIREVLEGKRRDVCHALVVVNATAALRVGGMTGSLRQCARCADAAIEAGRAAEKLDAYLAATRIALRNEDL
jgi:anthranilate phosphoribosyltransferase